MFRVYWSEKQGVSSVANYRDFTQEQLSETLTFMEELRKIEREGGPVSFVGMVSQNPNSVGHPGVAEPADDYNWYKRRTLALRSDAVKNPCGCHTCSPITFENMRMILCPDCGNKRCPKANHHDNPCTNSNEPGQPGSAY